MDLIIRLRDLGLLAINWLSEFGYNFFFLSVNDWLGTSLPIGNITMFELTCLSGVLIWLGLKIVQWLV